MPTIVSLEKTTMPDDIFRPGPRCTVEGGSVGREARSIIDIIERIKASQAPLTEKYNEYLTSGQPDRAQRVANALEDIADVLNRLGAANGAAEVSLPGQDIAESRQRHADDDTIEFSGAEHELLADLLRVTDSEVLKVLGDLEDTTEWTEDYQLKLEALLAEDGLSVDESGEQHKRVARGLIDTLKRAMGWSGNTELPLEQKEDEPQATEDTEPQAVEAEPDEEVRKAKVSELRPTERLTYFARRNQLKLLRRHLGDLTNEYNAASVEGRDSSEIARLIEHVQSEIVSLKK